MSLQDSEEFWKHVENQFFEGGLWDKNCAPSNQEIIKAVEPIFNWFPSISTDNNQFKKSSAKCMKYAEEAIEAANNGDEGRSLKLANMITAYAEDAGDLALGHSIRFQILDLFADGFYQLMEELESCITSPQRAKKINSNIKIKCRSGQILSPNLSKKELTRNFKEFQKQSKLPSVKKYYDDFKQEEDKKKHFTRELFTLKSPNPKAPALEDFVEIKYDLVKGRHLVVTKDVPVGTTLIVEKPFICGLANVFDLEINRCHHCFRERFTPIPCPNCVFVLYCSEKCLEESKDHHKNYECSVLPDLHLILSSTDDICGYLCAYSTICTFGAHQLFRAFQREQKQKEEEKQSTFQPSDVDPNIIPGVDPETGIYDSSSFYTITQMTRAKKYCSAQDAMVALALTRILQSRTNFFQQLELEPESQLKFQFQDFITLTLTNIFYNYATHARGESKYFDDPSSTSTIYAFSLEPTTKLSNHSCQQNIVVLEQSNLRNLGTVANASRDLKKGEELCRIYRGVPFYKEVKSIRQQSLEEDFNFKCQCVACLNDWPLMKELEAEKDRPKFCCPLCSHKIPPQPKMMTKENYGKIALNSGNNFTCSTCKSKYKEKELMTQFKRQSMALEITEKLVHTGTGQETLKALKTASTFFQNHLIPPSFHQETCQKLFGSAIYNSVTLMYD